MSHITPSVGPVGLQFATSVVVYFPYLTDGCVGLEGGHNLLKVSGNVCFHGLVCTGSKLGCLLRARPSGHKDVFIMIPALGKLMVWLGWVVSRPIPSRTWHDSC